MVKLRVAQNVLTYHGPKVRPLLNSIEALEFTVIILVIVFAKRNYVSLHLFLFFSEPLHDVPVLDRRHGQIKHIHVIVVYDRDTILYIPGLGSISDKLKIGVRTLF